MSIPTKTDLETLDISYLGQPFCETASKNETDLFTMDYAYNGQPFVRNNSDYTPIKPTTQGFIF